jgi:hypothetical protein
MESALNLQIQVSEVKEGGRKSEIRGPAFVDYGAASRSQREEIRNVEHPTPNAEFSQEIKR